MSRASVLLDEALTLGGGDRVGAVALLAELWASDPELMREALAVALQAEAERSTLPLPVRNATMIASPWLRPGVDWHRMDLARSTYIGQVVVEGGGPNGGFRYRGSYAYIPGRWAEAGVYNTSQEARDAVDKWLTAPAGPQWRLL